MKNPPSKRQIRRINTAAPMGLGKAPSGYPADRVTDNRDEFRRRWRKAREGGVDTVKI